MAPDERLTQDEGGKQPPKPQSSGPGAAFSRANPIHLALSELQEEFAASDPVVKPNDAWPRLVPGAPSVAPPASPQQGIAGEPSQISQPLGEKLGAPPREAGPSPRGVGSGLEFAVKGTQNRPDVSAPGSYASVGSPPRGSTRLGLLGSLVITAVTASVFGIIGAALYQQFFARSLATPPANPSDGASASAGAGQTKDSASTAISTSEVIALRSKLEAVADRLDQVQRRLDDTPASGIANAPAPDFSPLQRQLDEQVKTTQVLPRLVEDVAGLGRRLDALDKGQKALHDDLATAKPVESPRSEPEKDSTVTLASPTPAPGPGSNAPAPLSEPDRRDASQPIVEPIDGANDPLSQGAELFRQGKYQEALAIFTQLEKTSPDDARVWYFAALSRGFATRQWTGETLRLVQKGVAREKAGTPSSAEIDLAFRGLSGENITSDNGKKWLEFYRKNAKAK